MLKKRLALVVMLLSFSFSGLRAEDARVREPRMKERQRDVIRRFIGKIIRTLDDIITTPKP